MATMDMTLSDVIISYLEQFGVEYVFSVPGSPLGPLYDALARSRRRGGPRSILTRHEAGSAFMADGYARETGGIGACLATTGPGATNLITGVACAYADQVPMLVITAQTPLPTFGRGPFQESSADAMDIVGMFEHCTRYNSLVTHPKQLERKLAAALTVAMQTPKGPAHLSIPIDVLRASAGNESKIAFPNLYRLATEPSLVVDIAAMEKLRQELHGTLRQNQRIVLLIGHDCAGATEELTKFAELINASIVTTPRGKPWINPYHPLARGVFGFAGHETARRALTDESVGLILAAGTDLSEWSTSGWDPILMNDKLVHIHNTAEWFARSPMARLHVHGTISTIFHQLAEWVKAFMPEIKLANAGNDRGAAAGSPSECQEDLEYVPRHIKVQKPESCELKDSAASIKPQRVLRELIQRFPAETRFVIDSGNSVPLSIHYFFNRHPQNYYLSVGFASMAWAIGAAIGMAMGTENTPVICLTGDGCYLMSGQEITVAAEEGLPVIFVVLIDHAYGMIKHSLRLTSKEPADLAVPPVDFCQMAKAAGADAFTIRHPEDFEKLDYSAICRRKGPTLLEIYIDPEEAPPLGMA
jgi:acetolactate synthase-1/2/3 large subunit